MSDLPPHVPPVEAARAAESGLTAAGGGRFGIARYLFGLWRGERPLAHVFWTDMVIVGSLVNLAAALVALLLFAAGLPVAVGVAVYFSPLPYNVLLFLAVWRSAAREASPWSFAAQAAAMAWFMCALLL